MSAMSGDAIAELVIQWLFIGGGFFLGYKVVNIFLGKDKKKTPANEYETIFYCSKCHTKVKETSLNCPKCKQGLNHDGATYSKKVLLSTIKP